MLCTLLSTKVINLAELACDVAVAVAMLRQDESTDVRAAITIVFRATDYFSWNTTGQEE